MGSSGNTSENDGLEGTVEEEEEGSFNEVLADAILKRPASIRMGSRKGSARGSGSSSSDVSPGMSANQSLSNSWNGAPNGIDDHSSSSPREVETVEEEPREFTFPSLLDNVKPKSSPSSGGSPPPQTLSTSPGHFDSVLTKSLSVLQEEDVSLTGDGNATHNALSQSQSAPLLVERDLEIHHLVSTSVSEQ